MTEKSTAKISETDPLTLDKARALIVLLDNRIQSTKNWVSSLEEQLEEQRNELQNLQGEAMTLRAIVDAAQEHAPGERDPEPDHPVAEETA